MKKTEIAEKLKGLVADANGDYQGDNPARDVDAAEVLKLAKALHAEAENTLYRRMVRKLAPFLAVVCAPFVKAFRFFFPEMPEGFETWAEVRAARAKAQQEHRVWVEDNPRSWGMPFDTVAEMNAFFATHPLPEGDTDPKGVTRTEAIMKFKDPSFYIPGITAKMRKSIAEGTVLTDYLERKPYRAPANASIRAVAGLVTQAAPQTNEEAAVLVKLLEAALGKSAGEYIAEVELAKAKADAKKEDAADKEVKDTLEGVIGKPLTSHSNTIGELKSLMDALEEKGGF